MIQIQCSKCHKECELTDNKCPYCGTKINTESKYYCGKCESSLSIKQNLKCKKCNRIPKAIIIETKGERFKADYKYPKNKSLTINMTKDEQSYYILSKVAFAYTIANIILAFIHISGIYDVLSKKSLTNSQPELYFGLTLAAIIITLPFILLIVSFKTPNKRTKYILGIVTAIVVLYKTNILGAIIFILYLIKSAKMLANNLKIGEKSQKRS